MKISRRKQDRPWKANREGETMLSQTKRAKALRKMRRDESPKEKRARLDKRNKALNNWKEREKIFIENMEVANEKNRKKINSHFYLKRIDTEN
jgi:hypothetical protein